MMLRMTTAIAASLCLGQTALAATEYPLTLSSCGHEITVERPPERVVSVGQATTEILYLLGLSEKVVGTALWVNPVLDRFTEVDADVTRLSNNAPSYESVVGQHPDLVVTAYQWMIGPQGAVGTPEMFDDIAIPSWVMPTDCVGKHNRNSLDGTRTTPFDPELLYDGIATLARIFDVSARGDEVIADLRAREEAAKERARAMALPKDIRGVFWYSSADLAIAPYVAGANGVPGWMMATLGITNVIASEEEWPTVGWETIARGHPSFIAAARMDRRRLPADDITVKREFLDTDPVTREMPAVRNDRIVEIDAHAMDPSIRAIFALERLTDRLADFELSP